MKHFKASVLVAMPVAVILLGLPNEAQAQRRGGRPARVVVVNRPVLYSYNPFFDNPFFFDPFYSPWHGNQWGGYPYPYRYRVSGPEASVRLEVEPRDANVYVDGYFAGAVDQFDGVFQRLRVTPGQHEIVVQLDGYRSLKERLYLGPNASRKITRQLERLATGEPNEPLPTPAVEAADVREPFDAATAAPVPRARFPRRGPRATERARTSDAGALAIRVQPADAEVFIDGERWAGGSDDVELIVQLGQGPHRVEVQREGYSRVALDVHVRANETTPINVSLSKQ